MYANGHTGLAAVARLQRIGAALAAGEAPDREDARWLAGCFDRYFLEAAAGVDLDAALGLTQPPRRGRLVACSAACGARQPPAPSSRSVLREYERESDSAATETEALCGNLLAT
jgi:hypothetical protein